jgi:hypothetical protein
MAQQRVRGTGRGMVSDCGHVRQRACGQSSRSLIEPLSF